MEKKIIKIIFFLVLFFDFVSASTIKLDSEKYILYNMNDNRILMKQDENVKTDIASLTKIMTVIVSIENIKDFNKKITITSQMLNGITWDVVTAGFKVGDKVTYNDLLYGAILPSGADAVNALAISISGSKEKFVKLMNDKVKELGLKNTHFENPIGLYNKNNYSSAYDMAQILIYSLKNSKFKEVFSSKTYTFSTGKKTKSTIERYNEKSNKDISYITGAKTGYIKKAGYCLATTATLNNVDYLFITLNAFSNESTVHIKDHTKTYTYFNDNYGYKDIVNYDDIIVSLNTKYAKEEKVDILAKIDKQYYLENSFDKSKLKYEYDGVKTISYFTNQGTKLGHVKIKYLDQVIDEFDLYYKEYLTFSLISYIWLNKWLFLALLIVLLLIIRIIHVRIKKYLRRKRRRKNIKK